MISSDGKSLIALIYIIIISLLKFANAEQRVHGEQTLNER